MKTSDINKIDIGTILSNKHYVNDTVAGWDYVVTSISNGKIGMQLVMKTNNEQYLGSYYEMRYTQLKSNNNLYICESLKHDIPNE